MTEIEALVEAFTRFDGAAAAKIDWERLFPDWDSPVRRRYVHNTRSAAAGVLCPEGRPGCYQELRENSETGEWRAVCGRDSEECARRTLTRQQATEWALDVKALCQDLADSLKTGSTPQEYAPGIWDCGQLRGDAKQSGIVFVVGGDGLSERLECALSIYDGALVVIPSLTKAHTGQLAASESTGSVILDLEENFILAQGRISAKTVGDWDKMLSSIRGTGMKALTLKDAARVFLERRQYGEAMADATTIQPKAGSTEATVIATTEQTSTAAERKRYRISKRGVKKTRFNNKSYTMKTWRCHFEGRIFDLPDVVASQLLVELFRCPNRLFGAEELLSKLTGETAVIGDKKDLEWMGGKDEDGAEDVCGTVRSQVAERQERWDKQTVRAVMDKIKKLKQDIADCGNDPATASEKEALEDELDSLNGGLLRNTRVSASGLPVSKAFETDRMKAGNLIGKHMRKLIKQLKEIDVGFWKHLSTRNVLKYGQTCQYTKQSSYEWLIE
jgi:hypothetical protein